MRDIAAFLLLRSASRCSAQHEILQDLTDTGIAGELPGSQDLNALTWDDPPHRSGP
jgi:hypothetical protein